MKYKLKKVQSGAQTGADIAGLVVAKKFWFETGGLMPKGWKTQEGPHPEYAELYGMTEHESDSYVPRTLINVQSACGTIRIAGNLYSPGEILTLKGIRQYNKPHIDVDLKDPIHFEEVVRWICEKQLVVLNVAGNAEKTYPGTRKMAEMYLSAVFQSLRSNHEAASEESKKNDEVPADVPASGL